MRLFHASSNDLNNTLLTPKIPSNILTKLGVENGSIPRVSFAPDVKHCLLAIGYNRIKSGPKILNVYEPNNYKLIKAIHSNDLFKKNYVPDANKTLEVWVLNKVRVVYAGKIKIIRPTKKYIEVSLPTGDKMKNYYWEYKVLDGDLT